MLKSKHIERKRVVFILLLIVNLYHIFIYRKKKTNLNLLAVIFQDNWLNNSILVLKIKLVYVKCVSCT